MEKAGFYYFGVGQGKRDEWTEGQQQVAATKE